ncbi:hypothetical protein CRG98_034406 [Punica granatum]|uniref:ATPase AAA-type core domain-containing protein n=1 Tax=Punica granatum TaxID=22663 RepID=A0A2I0IMJ5_PUNGR|nr:hypothetical protein CRG98_034406 [Punica granatum]
MIWRETTGNSSSGSAMANFFSTVGSCVAATLVYRSMAYNLFPHQVQEYFFASIKHYLSGLTFRLILVIEEYEDLGKNELYEAAQLFNGVELRWVYSSRKVVAGIKVKHEGEVPTYTYKNRYFKLSFHKKHKIMVINSYLPHLIEEAESLKKGKKTPKLFTPSKGGYGYYGDRPRLWTSVSLDHPATFEILTMELAILDDHDRFVKRRHFYRKVGKAWKRGYLLYGPPGTGKSSLVAAMANYLKFDIYNLELTDVFSNSELRKLLVATANRSNLVVEDFNCSIEFHHPGTKSNEGAAAEGWGQARLRDLIVFLKEEKKENEELKAKMNIQIKKVKTNKKIEEKSDEKVMFKEIDDPIRSTKVTTAEMVEQLVKHQGKPTDAFMDLIEILKAKKRQSEDFAAAGRLKRIKLK